MACEWRGSEKVGLRSTTQWLVGSAEWPASVEGCNTRGMLAPFYGSTTLLLLRDCDFNSVSRRPLWPFRSCAASASPHRQWV